MYFLPSVSIFGAGRFFLLVQCRFFPRFPSLEQEGFFHFLDSTQIQRSWEDLLFLILTITENNNLSVENKEQAGSGI